MGGFGTGRRGNKSCTGDMRQVDVRRLQREGYLKPGTAYGWQWSRHGEIEASINRSVQVDQVTFTYRHRAGGEAWRDVHCTVPLERTPCTYGGTRTWWHCPCCARRVALLYIGNMPACRHCYQRSYRCEREGLDDRATRQADKLRDRLGWIPSILNGNGPKPKGMHWRTFERLQARHDALMQTSLMEMSRVLGVMESRLPPYSGNKLLSACRLSPWMMRLPSSRAGGTCPSVSSGSMDLLASGTNGRYGMLKWWLCTNSLPLNTNSVMPHTLLC